MHLQSLVEDFMLFILYLKEYTRLMRFSIIEKPKNGDDMIIAAWPNYHDFHN